MNCKNKKEFDKLANEKKRIEAELKDAEGSIKKWQNRHNELVADLIGVNDAMLRCEKREDVMNALNGHNPMLVIAINDLWNDDEHSKFLEIILRALYLRDMEEFQEKLTICPHLVMEDPLDYAHLYLTHVADDADLIAVLEFCRWDYEQKS